MHQSLTISEAFDSYIDDYITFKGQSKKTEEAYNVVRKQLIAYFGDVDICELKFQAIRQWKQHLDKGNRGPATVRGYIICLRVVLAYLKKNGILVCDPDLIPVPKRPEKIPEFVTPLQVAQFIHVAGKPLRGYSKMNRLRNMAIISLLYASGIRVSELCSLNRNSIKEDSFSVIGKGGKPRLCFIDDRTKMLITNYLSLRTDANPALFLSDQTGGRVTSHTVQGMFRNVCKRSGIDMNLHPHILRHSFATNLLRNNTNIRYVQSMLGHSSLATTQMYTHVVDHDLEQIYKKFHTI